MKHSDEIAEELNKIPIATKSPESFFARKTLESHLTEQADLQVAIDRMRGMADPVVSMSEMRRELGI